MDKQRFKALWRLFCLPVLLIVVGLILMIKPDSAIILVTKLLAWACVIIGAAVAISIATDKSRSGLSGWFWPALCLVAVGVYFLAKPLTLANVIARVIGVVMIIGGVDDLRGSRYGISRGVAILMLVAGVVFVILPSTLIHTVLGVCGLILLIIGVVELLGKLREMKRLESGSTPNIIDADE